MIDITPYLGPIFTILICGLFVVVVAVIVPICYDKNMKS